MKKDRKKIICENREIPAFSVIMPIYNGEAYLDYAISSVMSQTEHSWELIAVNDGSTDTSSEMCKKYVEKDNRIRLIEKEKSGVSDSRNKGLEVAKGKWIIFLDADDWFEENFLYELKRKIDELPYDFYICNYYNAIDEKQKFQARDITFNKMETFVFSEIANASLRQSQWKKKEYYGNLRTVWAKCFKREYINKNHIRFCSQLTVGEDMLFVLEYLKYINNICYINYPLYNYRYNPISVMHSRKWNGNMQGKLYFYKVEEVVGNIVGEGAKADLWLETAEEDWKVLYTSDIGFLSIITIFRKLMRDELYIRFSKKGTFVYSSKKQRIYVELIRRKAVLCLMLLSYCRVQKCRYKSRKEMLHFNKDNL